MSTSIALPFQVINGRIATTSDPTTQLTNRVYSLIATQPGERVMRPAYGADTMQFAFGDGDELDRVAMEETVRTALTVWEPGAKLLGVQFDDYPDDHGNLTVQVAFVPNVPIANGSNAVTPQVLYAVLSSGGSVTQIAAPASSQTPLGGASVLPAPRLVTTQPRYLGTVE